MIFYSPILFRKLISNFLGLVIFLLAITANAEISSLETAEQFLEQHKKEERILLTIYFQDNPIENFNRFHAAYELALQIKKRQKEVAPDQIMIINLIPSKKHTKMQFELSKLPTHHLKITK